MDSFFLQQGLVISFEGQTLEFIRTSAESFCFEEPSTGQQKIITQDDFWDAYSTKQITIVNAFSSPKALHTPPEIEKPTLIHLDDLPPRYQAELDRKMQYLVYLRKTGLTRGQTRLIGLEIAKLATELRDPHPPSVPTIQRAWRILERHNFEPSAIVSKNSRRSGGSRLNRESEAFLQEKIDEYFLIQARPTPVAAYRRYIHALNQENRERQGAGITLLDGVSVRTFQYRIKALPKEEVLIARFGREAARHHFNMVRGVLPASHPLDAVEIDHTPMNMYVIDDRSFLPLGRPWLTVIKDRYSGVMLGFYVCFNRTGLDSIFGAIKHSLTSHHKAYELWPDIENPWPAFGRGHYYTSDRGADFLSPRYRNAIMSLGAFYEYCQVRTPWLKGSVERFFLTMEQTFFEAMPGRTFSSLAKRGDYNPAKDCVIRFSTLIYLLHKWVADYHNVFPNARKQARPLDLWMDGIELAPPPYPANVDELNIILGQHQSAKLNQEGLQFSWLHYSSESLKDLMCYLGKGITLDFVVSQENLGSINVKDPRSNQYFTVPCNTPEYAEGLSLFQHQYLRKEAGIRLTKSTALEALIKTREQMHDRFCEEILAKDNKAKSRLAQIAGINSNSVLEGKSRTIKQPFSEQPPAPDKVLALDSAPITNVPIYAWGI